MKYLLAEFLQERVNIVGFRKPRCPLPALLCSCIMSVHKLSDLSFLLGKIGSDDPHLSKGGVVLASQQDEGQ
jgi:hypothetical protein